jgi:hypothetical protein
MISTLVENSFPFPFFSHTSGNDSKAEVLLRHAQPSDFICKRYRNCIHHLLSWRNEVLDAVESGGAFLDVRAAFGPLVGKRWLAVWESHV